MVTGGRFVEAQADVARRCAQTTGHFQRTIGGQIKTAAGFQLDVRRLPDPQQREPVLLGGLTHGQTEVDRLPEIIG